MSSEQFTTEELRAMTNEQLGGLLAPIVYVLGFNLDAARVVHVAADRLRAAPDLLALAHQYAAECGECAGLGYSLGRTAEHVDCPDCVGIRSVILKAEGA